MRLTLFLFLLFILSCGDQPNKPIHEEKKDVPDIEKEEFKEDYGETECITDDNFTAGESGFFEPRAVVTIVAFEDTTYSEAPCKIRDGEFVTINELESITLNEIQKKELEAILLGTKTKRLGNISDAASCYIPRHAIVYAGSEKVVAIQEICFECYGQRFIGKGLGYIDFCDGKWSDLKDFFERIGITYYGPEQK